MMRLSRSRMLAPAIAGVLLLLLVTLATLQWRWIGEVCALERHRLQSALMMTGARMAEEVDSEVTRLFLALHPDLGAAPVDRLDEMVRQLERWRAGSAHPGLVGPAYLLRPDGDATGPTVERVQADAGGLVPGPWPPELAGLRERLRQEIARRGRPEDFVGTRVVAPGTTVLFVPLAFPRRAGARPHDPLSGLTLLVELDQHSLATEILPELGRAALRWHTGEDVLIAVVDPSRPGQVVYRSDPAAPAALDQADLCLPILGVRPFAELRSLHAGNRPAPRHAPAAWPHQQCDATGGDGTADGWRLLLRRRGDSIEQVVARLRWHNLAASLGILALLALAAVVLVATTARARRLARQQIEFVAGVTHELHTPITAIRAAGENLADGVVAGGAQVQRYGVLIEAEGRRLSTLVTQLLELAGIQAGRRVYRFEPVEVDAIVDGALRESRRQLDEAGITVERDLPGGLPRILGDAAVLRRGLQNLVDNAVKYAGAARWLGVRARATADGVDIAIEDRGPGVPRDELAHLFEPFFRGRDAAAGARPGVGLGLALVRGMAEAHGGWVSVASRSDGPDRGATFTLHLPAAPPTPAAEVDA
jgi:signal transduction histidine kinase